MYITSIHFFRLFPPAFWVTVTKLKFVSIFIWIEKTATENFRTEKISDKLQSEFFSAEMLQISVKIFSADFFPTETFSADFG